MDQRLNPFTPGSGVKLLKLAGRDADLEAFGVLTESVRTCRWGKDMSEAQERKDMGEAQELNAGVAGQSASREADRRRERLRQARTSRSRLANALLGPSAQQKRLAAEEKHWATGARGEEMLAEALAAKCPEADLLHDRRIPKSRANIDHIAVTRTGVYVIDAKRYRGKVEVRSPLFGKPKLVIAGRDRTKLVAGLETPGLADVEDRRLSALPPPPARQAAEPIWPFDPRAGSPNPRRACSAAPAGVIETEAESEALKCLGTDCGVSLSLRRVPIWEREVIDPLEKNVALHEAGAHRLSCVIPVAFSSGGTLGKHEVMYLKAPGDRAPGCLARDVCGGAEYVVELVGSHISPTAARVAALAR
jgi:hypothetical protein